MLRPALTSLGRALRLAAILACLAAWPGSAAALEITAADVPHPNGRPACPVSADRIEFTTPILPDTEVVIAAVGDVLLHSPLQRQGFQHEDGFRSLWRPVEDILSAADFAYANLEGPLAVDRYVGGGTAPVPVTNYDGRVYTGYPLFNYPPRVAPALAASGIDVVSTANNHSLDRRPEGVDLTIAALREANIQYTGTRPTTEPGHPWHTVTRIGDYRIAWLACSYSTNGLPDPQGQVLMCFEQQELVLEIIESLASRRGIDGVILTPHWGHEYQHTPNARQQALAQAAIDAGAIAVIGAHPHVVQPAERLVSRDDREGFAIYSLGNFVSNQRELPRRSNLIALLGLAETPWGDLTVSGFAWVPMHVNFRDGIAEIAAEAIERSGGRGIASHNHLTGLLPAGNIHPPGPPLTTLQCPDTSANGPMARLQHGFTRVPIPPRLPGIEPGA